ncbi:Transposable element tcb2 transposase [Caligus rogercresseyi]|uniref:Transposable element tcb2 transposase n=1 Tax=Caligus rogercresseyi TaxID=217165 RepID=A0A7T8JUF5_CALRO|nr:Transposable element tcb2 transposase [Caligus rogercresseyi]
MCGSRMVHHLIWRLRPKSSARTIWPISGRKLLATVIPGSKSAGFFLVGRN